MREQNESNLKGGKMKAYFLFTGTGPVVILTTYNSVEHTEVIKRLESKGIAKFIAYEVPVESIKDKYGTHFNIVLNDLHESDDLRVLDYSGERAFKKFSFKELSAPIFHEP